MAQSGLHSGAVISVSAFDGDGPLRVEILSSRSVDSGASAIILKGEMRPREGIGSPVFVALKVFPSVINEVKRELFHRELLAARRLRHRSILPFIGSAVVGLHMIIVARFMQNGNMSQYLRQNPSLDRKPLLLDIAHAVHFLHVWAGVIHGDLKCEDVLISDAGKALLADFGLSTFVDKAESSTTTATGIRQQNTIRFAAPELFLGEPDDGMPSTNRQRSKSTKSDVYASSRRIRETSHGQAATTMQSCEMFAWGNCIHGQETMRSWSDSTTYYGKFACRRGHSTLPSDPAWPTSRISSLLRSNTLRT